jgi:PAS domain S-box-containing protein
MNGKKKTILVVDDVPDDILILEEILKAEYQVKAVTGGEAALAIARSDTPPDLILLDIMMPEIDGFEVCRRLKADAEGATIPVIFLTAKGKTADEKLGFEVGAADYIRKPVDPDIVRSRIKANLEQKDRALRISEVRYRRLFETAQDGIMIVDSPTGAIVDVNPSMAALMGLSQEAFLGKRFDEFEFLRTIMLQQRGLTNGERSHYVRYKDLPLATFDGRQIYVEFISKAYQVNGRELMQLNMREITDLVAAEHERDEFASRLAHYLSTSPTVTYSLVLRNGSVRWQWISENVHSILGYSSEEALRPDWWFGNVHAADRARVLGIISDLSQQESASREYRFARKDRSVVWLHDEMRLLPGRGGDSEIVGTLTDISERKSAEEEIHLKSAALEAAANAVVITDREGMIRWANPAFGELTGYAIGEALGRNPRDLVYSGRQVPDFYRTMWETILAGKVWSGRLENRKKNGELYHEEMTITPVFDESRHVNYFIAIKSDITESVLARRRLEAALDAKEALLREVHLRVNNNMQVIISLLAISANGIDDEVLRGKLEDISRRMYAMSIIHGQFQETDDMSRIGFTTYLRQLVDSLKAEYPLTSTRINTDFSAGEVFLNLEQAVPAGLIVSELVTNALAYAFPDDSRSGEIIVLEKWIGDGRLEIEIADQGIGLPAGFDPISAQSLGMVLIRVLSTQLGGAVEFHSGNGTSARLRFHVAPVTSMPETGPVTEKEESHG